VVESRAAIQEQESAAKTFKASEAQCCCLRLQYLKTWVYQGPAQARDKEGACRVQVHGHGRGGGGSEE
jgi:hypothetical protein